MTSRLPAQLMGVRICLFVVAALTAVLVTAGMVLVEPSPRAAGLLTYQAIPGVLALVFALLLPQGGRALYWAILVLQGLLLLMSLGNLGNGHPQGLTQMVFPIVIIVLVTRPVSRAYLNG